MAKTAGKQGISLKNLLNIEKKVVRVKKPTFKVRFREAGPGGKMR
jgi:hypothetical protein